MKKRVFSGVQPTGLVHIGNYLGAIRNWVGLLDRHECIFCIVDYHAITVPYDPKAMQKRILETAIAYMACGIDPEKCTIFVQSQVPEHTELTWILNTLAPVGLLERQTQYKDKTTKTGDRPFGSSERDENAAKMGLLDYPVLQAADILLYKAEIVPVGEDQAQHLELARDLARKFNNTFGRLFPEPKTLTGVAPKILGVDGRKKMSKSMNNYISLMDDPDAIRKKIRKAVTDPVPLFKGGIVFDEQRPAITNLLTIYSCFTGKSTEEAEDHFQGKGYKELKDELAEALIEGLTPIRERWMNLASNPVHVWSILEEGAQSCRQIAGRTMGEVKERMGLIHG
jgi:tryptophanyl-tRNA synthetase